jgi:hypothetical protein
MSCGHELPNPPAMNARGLPKCHCEGGWGERKYQRLESLLHISGRGREPSQLISYFAAANLKTHQGTSALEKSRLPRRRDKALSLQHRMVFVRYVLRYVLRTLVLHRLLLSLLSMIDPVDPSASHYHRRRPTCASFRSKRAPALHNPAITVKPTTARTSYQGHTINLRQWLSISKSISAQGTTPTLKETRR